jgi:hypothetical protein
MFYRRAKTPPLQLRTIFPRTEVNPTLRERVHQELFERLV